VVHADVADVAKARLASGQDFKAVMQNAGV
jgi:hypothetical protein